MIVLYAITGALATLVGVFASGLRVGQAVGHRRGYRDGRRVGYRIARRELARAHEAAETVLDERVASMVVRARAYAGEAAS